MHQLHNDYPLISEKRKTNHDMFSNYCITYWKCVWHNIGIVNKLIPDLINESKYVPHYKNLQLYLSLRLKLIKSHRLLKVEQYIDFNTEKRKNVANSFEKDFLKLMKNSGKFKKNNKCYID